MRLDGWRTAHDVAADWEWMDHAEGFFVGSAGWVVWEQASYGSGRLVRISRLVEMPGMKLRQINRYVDPDARVQLTGITRTERLH